MKNDERPGYGLVSKYRAELMGFAILMIMFCHLDVAQSHNGFDVSFLGKVLHTFTVGVDVFMFLSGLGLYYSYSSKQPSYWSFEKKRLIRILPLYFIIAGATYILFDLILRKLTLAKLFRDLFFLSWFLSGSTLYWYILAIVCFYALFPLLYRFIHGGKHGLVKVVVFSVLWWTLVGVGSKHSAMLESFKIALDRLPIFMFGIYCGKLVRENRRLRAVEWLSYFIIGYLALIILLRTRVRALSFVLYYPVRALLGLSVIATLILIMELLNRRIPRMARMLSEGMRWLGGLTLECYLFHQSYLILFAFPYRPAQYVLVAFVLPTVSAALLYLLRKCLRKGRHA